MSSKRWIALVISITLFIFYAIGQLTTTFIFADEEENWREEVYLQGGLDQIALLEVEGNIIDQTGGELFSTGGYQHRIFLKQLEHAFKSETIKGIVLRINSPGGGVVESDEIYHTIRKLKQEYPKPIVTYMSNMAASGGYYISAPTDKIYANRSVLTGSIGVIIQSYNFAELADQWGIRSQTFTSGPHKDILSPMREMTEEERNIMQELVDEMYDQFVDVIVEGRGMDREKVLQLADGRIYSGGQAQELGLVDEIGYLEDAIDGTAALAEIEEPTVIRFKRSPWSSFNEMLVSLPSTAGDLLGIQRTIQQKQSPSFLYLYTW